MFEVDVKNVTEQEEEQDQLGFGVQMAINMALMGDVNFVHLA